MDPLTLITVIVHIRISLKHYSDCYIGPFNLEHRV